MRVVDAIERGADIGQANRLEFRAGRGTSACGADRGHIHSNVGLTLRNTNGGAQEH